MGGVLALHTVSTREPSNQVLDSTVSCSEAVGYYRMDRPGQSGISAAEVLAKQGVAIRPQARSQDRTPD
ncbi:MAG: hypothetical protein KA002_00030 [Firmicutes bacterium]|nr:hypothetical protein [Bacillota bacterium]